MSCEKFKLIKNHDASLAIDIVKEIVSQNSKILDSLFIPQLFQYNPENNDDFRDQVSRFVDNEDS